MKTPIQTRPPPSRGGKIQPSEAEAPTSTKNPLLTKSTGTVPCLVGSEMLLSDVSSVRSTANDVFGARGAGSGWDTVEAGRHPPADGRTPETAAQRAVAAAEQPSLKPLHGCGIAGNPKVDDEWINVLSESCARACKQI